LRRIAALGCDEAQGYYLGRPQTLAAFERHVLDACAPAAALELVAG
jgi:EAL domain-containing protein (putative c-di-GMP-specific phosphodiesterase class I)